MALTRLEKVLAGHRRIALDTSIFIFKLENNPKYFALADHVFAWIERPGHSAVTSTVTMMELLVAPFRRAERDRADAFYALLSTYPNLEWLTPDLAEAALAAEVRAQFGLQAADALQAATAIRGGATLLISNDKVFRRLPGIESLVLDDLL